MTEVHLQPWEVVAVVPDDLVDPVPGPLLAVWSSGEDSQGPSTSKTVSMCSSAPPDVAVMVDDSLEPATL